jgi:hypothetical protein
MDVIDRIAGVLGPKPQPRPRRRFPHVGRIPRWLRAPRFDGFTTITGREYLAKGRTLYRTDRLVLRGRISVVTD